jgi:hypothetical protein
MRQPETSVSSKIQHVMQSTPFAHATLILALTAAEAEVAAFFESL